MYNNIDLEFSSPPEICQELGSRLKTVRLAKHLQQTELAQMAGVSKLTIINLEQKGTVNLMSLIRIVCALGLIDELSPLFRLQPKSIAMMESLAALKTRSRVSSKRKKPI